MQIFCGPNDRGRARMYAARLDSMAAAHSLLLLMNSTRSDVSSPSLLCGRFLKRSTVIANFKKESPSISSLNKVCRSQQSQRESRYGN